MSFEVKVSDFLKELPSRLNADDTNKIDAVGKMSASEVQKQPKWYQAAYQIAQEIDVLPMMRQNFEAAYGPIGSPSQNGRDFAQLVTYLNQKAIEDAAGADGVFSRSDLEEVGLLRDAIKNVYGRIEESLAYNYYSEAYKKEAWPEGDFQMDMYARHRLTKVNGSFFTDIFETSSLNDIVLIFEASLNGADRRVLDNGYEIGHVTPLTSGVGDRFDGRFYVKTPKGDYHIYNRDTFTPKIDSSNDGRFLSLAIFEQPMSRDSLSRLLAEMRGDLVSDEEEQDIELTIRAGNMDGVFAFAKAGEALGMTTADVDSFIEGYRHERGQDLKNYLNGGGFVERLQDVVAFIRENGETELLHDTDFSFGYVTEDGKRKRALKIDTNQGTVYRIPLISIESGRLKIDVRYEDDTARAVYDDGVVEGDLGLLTVRLGLMLEGLEYGLAEFQN